MLELTEGPYRGVLSEQAIGEVMARAADGFVRYLRDQRRAGAPADLAFDRAAVGWLDDAADSWLGALRAAVDAEPEDEASDRVFEAFEVESLMGAFFGECLIRCHGGRWAWHADSQRWGIERPAGKGYAFPFTKLDKRVGSPSDSLVSMFDVYGAGLP